MGSSNRVLRFGFGFYLGISALIHVVAFVGLSFIPMEDAETQAEEVVPTQIKFREPLEETSVSQSVPEYLPVDSFVSTGEGDRRVREATGLPSHLRSSPRPHAYAKSSMVRYVELPDPDQLAPEYRPPTTQELPRQLREIDVTLEEMQPLQQIPTVRTGEEGQSEDFMSLGDEMEQEDRRQLVRRPSFPYARVREYLPREETRLVYTLTINEKGSVLEANMQSGQISRSRLTQILGDWLRGWEYQSGEGVVRQQITIEIPGEQP